MKELINKIKKIDKEDKVSFVVLFGSYASKTHNKLSDIDVAVYYEGSKKERFKFRLITSGELSNKYDIHIFQDMPIYIRKEIVKKGKIIYKKDTGKVAEVYFKVIKEFSSFEKYLNHYYNKLKGEAIA